MFIRRTIILALVFTALLGALALRLYQLQVLEHNRYRELGRQRTHRLQQLPPARGRILDRRGRVLAEDRLRFDLWVKAARKPQRKSQNVVPYFGEITPEKITELKTTAAKNLSNSPDATNGNPPTDDLLNSPERSASIGYLANFPALTQFADYLRRENESPLAARTRLAAITLDALLRADNYSAPERVLTDVPLPAVLAVQQAQANPYTAEMMGGWELRPAFSRFYPQRELFGHITGYVNALSADEYKTLRGYWNELGEPVAGSGVLKSKNSDQEIFFEVASGSDEQEIIALREIRQGEQIHKTWGDLRNPLVGRTGIEQWYNQELRGEHRWRLEELTKSRRGWRTFIEVGNPPPPKNGKDITLTIDADFQRQVRDLTLAELKKLARLPEHSATLMRHKLPIFPAAVVVLNARNGEIYALVSLPEYDPNKIRENYEQWAKDPAKPLLNRVSNENFPPGSSLKPLVAATALRLGKIYPTTEFDCQGVERIGNREFVCMHRAHHGLISAAAALRVSCNIFFYHTGGALGARNLVNGLAELGIGSPTGIDLPNETAGMLVADNSQSRGGLSLGEVWHIAIGQGKVAASLLQICAGYAAIVNDGKKIRPHLRRVADKDLTAISQPANDKGFATVQRGMWEVVQGNRYPRGTAYREGKISGFEYIGKTGSAQGKRPDTHAWFVAAAPANEPEIIVGALVPYGNHGGNTCAPIVKKIIQSYFHLDEFPVEDETEFVTDSETEDEFTGDDESD